MTMANYTDRCDSRVSENRLKNIAETEGFDCSRYERGIMAKEILFLRAEVERLKTRQRPNDPPPRR